MTKTPTTIDKEYHRLVKAITREINLGQQAIQEFTRYQTVLTYWVIGRHIAAFLQHPGHHHLNKRTLVGLLEKDLSINARTLSDGVTFYQAYPKLDAKKPLAWSHYRYLMRMPSRQERLRWEQKIIKEDISVEQFRALMVQKNTEAKQVRQTAAGLTPQPLGRLYHYRMVSMRNFATEAVDFYIDCGFLNFIRPPENPETRCRWSNKRIYESRKTDDGQYVLNQSQYTKQVLYTYQAQIERIIDADTLLVKIDCGFGIYRREKLRLKGIDAPERATLAGKCAVQWIAKTLRHSPVIIIRTSKSDKYDRYLADVYYLPKSSDPKQIIEQGIYLNGQMVEEGVAKLWRS